MYYRVGRNFSGKHKYFKDHFLLVTDVHAAVLPPLIWAKMCNIQRKTHTQAYMYVLI